MLQATSFAGIDENLAQGNLPRTRLYLVQRGKVFSESLGGAP